MRLRVGSYPLRVCTGRNEGSGAANARDARRRGAEGGVGEADGGFGVGVHPGLRLFHHEDFHLVQVRNG